MPISSSLLPSNISTIFLLQSTMSPSCRINTESFAISKRARYRFSFSLISPSAAFCSVISMIVPTMRLAVPSGLRSVTCALAIIHRTESSDFSTGYVALYCSYLPDNVPANCSNVSSIILAYSEFNSFVFIRVSTHSLIRYVLLPEESILIPSNFAVVSSA